MCGENIWSVTCKHHTSWSGVGLKIKSGFGYIIWNAIWRLMFTAVFMSVALCCPSSLLCNLDGYLCHNITAFFNSLRVASIRSLKIHIHNNNYCVTPLWDRETCICCAFCQYGWMSQSLSAHLLLLAGLW